MLPRLCLNRDRGDLSFLCLSFFFNDTATTEIYTLSLHDALPIFSALPRLRGVRLARNSCAASMVMRSEEHTSELQSQSKIVCRLLLEKKKKQKACRVAPHQRNGANQNTKEQVDS